MAAVVVDKVESWYTQVALKVMPPIYFHGSHNRYKEYNNTI